MPEREVTLVKGAQEKAKELGVPVGFLQSDDQFDREVDKGGKVTVHNRDYHLLKTFDLIKDDVALVSPAADQPEAEEAADTSRTKTRDRGPSGTDSQVAVGGVGHQEGDAHGQDRIQAEIARSQPEPEKKTRKLVKDEG